MDFLWATSSTIVKARFSYEMSFTWRVKGIFLFKWCLTLWLEAFLLSTVVLTKKFTCLKTTRGGGEFTKVENRFYWEEEKHVLTFKNIDKLQCINIHDLFFLANSDKTLFHLNSKLKKYVGMGARMIFHFVGKLLFENSKKKPWLGKNGWRVLWQLFIFKS